MSTAQAMLHPSQNLRSNADLIAQHPQPWRVERNWSYEVLDANDAVVDKFPSQADAENFISQAT